MIEKQIYVAVDGKPFDTSEECAAYEKPMRIESLWATADFEYFVYQKDGSHVARLDRKAGKYIQDETAGVPMGVLLDDPACADVPSAPWQYSPSATCAEVVYTLHGFWVCHIAGDGWVAGRGAMPVDLRELQLRRALTWHMAARDVVQSTRASLEFQLGCVADAEATLRLRSH